MNKKYLLEGLDCANCASKIERGLKKLNYIEAVTVNFMTRKLLLKSASELNNSMEDEIFSTIKKIDKNIVIRSI